MEIILLKDHPYLGEKGKIVEVANGYARNYLIPQKLAIRNTPGNLSAFEAEGQFRKKKVKEERESAQVVKEEIQGKEIRITAKAGKDGKLYGSVTKQDISDALKKEGYEVDKRDIKIDEPIKETGTYEIQLNLFEDARALVSLVVEGEND
ncbi:MAG: 50S ribosomal protein L9 [candidate division WOR-3 bacterium]|nr:50S ribosomal protein L9 [candidate division WOR-3 bacterium]